MLLAGQQYCTAGVVGGAGGHRKRKAMEQLEADGEV
jgi:hypothetical protein